MIIFIFFDYFKLRSITGGDMGRLRDSKGTGSGDSYRVLLIDDARHSENLGNLFA